MNWQIVIRTLKSDYMKLVPILALAFYLAFIPHLNYPYPVHLDEWMALESSEKLLKEGGFIIGEGRFLETGFHLFWGTFHQISGIAWMDIFRYFPGIVFMITVLSVYLFAQREGFGWEAALFTSLLPTTVGILGPALLVPLTMALPFIPLALFVTFNFKTVWSYLVLFIIVCFLLITHATTAVALVIVLIPSILINLKGNFKHSLGITLAVVLPFLVPFAWIFNMVIDSTKSLLVSQVLLPYVDYPWVIQIYGYLPILFFLLGVFVLTLRGGKKNHSLIFGSLALLLMLVTFFVFHYGIEIIYGRGFMYTMLMMSIVAGAGLKGIRTLKIPARFTGWMKTPLLTQNVGNILCVALIGLTLATVIPIRQNTPYYHMIDEQDYQAFVWIRDNVSDSYQKAILDPWKGWPFSAITQEDVYTAIKGYPKPSDEEAYAFLEGGSSNTTFLRENGISVVYTRVSDRSGKGNIEYSSDNPDLVEVAKNIYLLKEAGKEE